ncbi:MAG: alpha/beta hydrolase [Spirochaetaceae bacterium]|nr:MAG: alpha/beta hydrolase [Spirochaetaceae bacterium]
MREICQAIIILIGTVLIIAGICVTVSCKSNDENRSTGEQSIKVRVTSDIVFKTSTDSRGRTVNLALDLYEPDNDNNVIRPLMVWIHGGGFYQGDKRDDPMIKLATYFARAGFACASINYRLLASSNADWSSREKMKLVADAAIDDAKAALCFLSEHRTQYRFDTSNIIIGGGSAGAFISLHVAYGNQDSLCGIKIGAVVDFWGGLFDISLMKAGGPPVLVFHGTNDNVVPYVFAEQLVSRAKESGVYLELHSLVNEGHSAWGHMDEYYAIISAFLSKQVPPVQNGK